MKIDVRGTIIPNDEKWIYDWFELEATCPKDVADALTGAGGEPVEIQINSGGGDVFSGVDIYEAIRAYEGNVTIRVIWAASAASVIACAAKSEISPAGMVMLHNVSSMARGDYHAMDKASDTLQKVNRAVSAAYMAKTGKTEKELLAAMDKETWYTAQQAVDMGLIDKISEPAARFAASAPGALPPAVIEKIRAAVKNPPTANENTIVETERGQMRLALEILKLKGKCK